MRRIQFISDIHLEFYKTFPKIKSFAPILCLAGDIGYPNMHNYINFLADLNANHYFNKIFLVTGNHEYYYQNDTIENTNEKINYIIKSNKLSKISFLNNSSEMYNDYLFVGSTFWSKVINNDVKSNDFYRIKDMTADKYNELHNTSVSFLRSEIEKYKDKKIVVLTHHLPSYKLINKKYKDYEKYHQYFASSNDNLIKPPVVAWIHGHSHMPHKLKINNIIIASNPIGYYKENRVNNRNKDNDVIYEDYIEC